MAGSDSDLCEIRRETLAKFCPIKTSCVAGSVVEHEGMITGANSKDADISRSKFEFIAPDDTRDDGEEAREGGRVLIREKQTQIRLDIVE